MKMMKRLIPAFLLLWGLSAEGRECRTANFFLNFDVDSTDVTYGVVQGEGLNPFGGGISSSGKRIETSGSSTTVSSDTAGDNSFAEVSAGDTIFIPTDGTITGRYVSRYVISKADSDTITVDTAINIASAVPFRWLKATTSATVGWLDISAYAGRTITVEYNQGDLGRLDVRVECRGSYPGSSAVQVFPSCTTGSCDTYQAYTTVGIASRTSIAIPEPFGACRVGVKYATSDASDATTNREIFTAGFEGCLDR